MDTSAAVKFALADLLLLMLRETGECDSVVINRKPAASLSQSISFLVREHSQPSNQQRATIPTQTGGLVTTTRGAEC